MRIERLLLVLALTAVIGCSKEQAAPGPVPSATHEAATAASASAASSAAIGEIAGATASAVDAAPSASSAAEPEHTCPSGSSGVGSFSKPCEGKGGARLMSVKWTKTGDAGPTFAITNKSQLVVVYGKIAAYFYDKAGKQLEVKDETAPPPHTKPFHTCAGKFFGGLMAAGEKATLNFSCVPKSVVPEGTASVEGEMQWVGFADASGKKIDFYWRNNDLTPDKRPKGGVK